MAGAVGPSEVKVLSNLVSKLLSNNARFTGVEFRILAPSAQGRPYLIELSKGRANRQVTVDPLTLKRMISFRKADIGLIRELRIALLQVLRLSARRDAPGSDGF